MNLQVVAIETVRFSGFEDATVVIEGPCSGLYSMMLLVGIIAGYAKMEHLTEKNKLFLLVMTAIIVAYISNLIRASMLYYVAYYYGIEKVKSRVIYLFLLEFVLSSVFLILSMQSQQVNSIIFESFAEKVFLSYLTQIW